MLPCKRGIYDEKPMKISLSMVIIKTVHSMIGFDTTAISIIVQ